MQHRMIARLLTTAFLLLSLCCIFPLSQRLQAAPASRGATALARSYAEEYKNLQGLSTDELLKKGAYYRDIRHRLDSAMACYSIVAVRYRPDMNAEEANECLKGYYGRWQTQFFNTANFLGALEDLQMAEEIVNRHKLSHTLLYYCYGCVYMSLAVSTDEDEYDLKSSIMLRASFHQAYKEKDYRTMHRAFDNIVSVYRVREVIDSLAPEAKIMYELKEPEMWRRKVSLLIYEGVVAQQKNDLNTALAKYDELIRTIPHDLENGRYLASAYLKRSRVERAMGNKQQAYNTLNEALRLTYLYEIADVRSSVLAAVTDVLKELGRDHDAAKTNMHYMELKDSIMNARYVINCEQVGFNNERNKLQQALGKAESQRTFQMWMLILCAIIIITVTVSLLAIRRKNRRLRDQSEVLYRQLQESLRQEDEQNEETAAPEEKEGETAERYQSSNLDQEQKLELADKIRAASRSEEFLNPDFNQTRLAEMLDTLPRYISQTVNEIFGCNFSTYVNQVRIREAMRRLGNNPKYAYYSIEGIAESVGFKSRSGFTAWFKRIAGLSPSEFRRMAQKDAENKS